ncbi:hypothetical protein ACA910_022040 [Epithemia clementina (nom. ined.)]
MLSSPKRNHKVYPSPSGNQSATAARSSHSSGTVFSSPLSLFSGQSHNREPSFDDEEEEEEEESVWYQHQQQTPSSAEPVDSGTILPSTPHSVRLLQDHPTDSFTALTEDSFQRMSLQAQDSSDNNDDNHHHQQPSPCRWLVQDEEERLKPHLLFPLEATPLTEATTPMTTTTTHQNPIIPPETLWSTSTIHKNDTSSISPNLFFTATTTRRRTDNLSRIYQPRSQIPAVNNCDESILFCPEEGDENHQDLDNPNLPDETTIAMDDSVLGINSDFPSSSSYSIAHGKRHVRTTLFPEQENGDYDPCESRSQTQPKAALPKVQNDTDHVSLLTLHPKGRAWPTSPTHPQALRTFFCSPSDKDDPDDDEERDGVPMATSLLTFDGVSDPLQDSSCITLSSFETASSPASSFPNSPSGPYEEQQSTRADDHSVHDHFHRPSKQQSSRCGRNCREEEKSSPLLERGSRHRSRSRAYFASAPHERRAMSGLVSVRSPPRKTLLVTPSSSAWKSRRVFLVRTLLWIWTAVGLVSTTALVVYQWTYLDHFLVGRTIQQGQQRRHEFYAFLPKLRSLTTNNEKEDRPSGRDYSPEGLDLSSTALTEEQVGKPYYRNVVHLAEPRDSTNAVNKPPPTLPSVDRFPQFVYPPANNVLTQHKRQSMPEVNSFVLYHHDPTRGKRHGSDKSTGLNGNNSAADDNFQTPSSEAKRRAVSLDGRPLSPPLLLETESSNHRTIQLYPASYTDRTQLYGVLDSSDPRVRDSMERRYPLDDGECIPMKEWQTSFHPSCNDIHALGLERLGDATTPAQFHLFGTKGYWRNAWKVDALSNDTVVLKTLKFKHNFEEAHFEHDRIDAVAMERLTASKHVINIFGFCGHSVVTEYANGKRLGSLADRSKKIPLARLRIAHDIAEGLADVHGIDQDITTSGTGGVNTSTDDSTVATFVHLDINPANVVSVGGTLKLNDFNIGILRRWNMTAGNRAQPCGFPAQYPNPQWRSPEEARNESNLTEKVDVYSMGHIFFRLICGHEPWNKLEPGGRPSTAAVTEAVQRGQLPTIPKHILDSTNEEIVAIRRAMLACYTVDPSKRPSARQIALQLQRELDRLEQQQQVQYRKKSSFDVR